MNNGCKPLSGDLKNEKKLINFLPDWISLNVRRRDLYLAQSILFLNSIFEKPHNDTNAAYYESILWLGLDQVVSLSFLGTIRQGVAVQIIYEGVPIIRIVKINQTSSKSKYEFQINFTGMFFDFHRLGYYSVKDFVKIFLYDIANNDIEHSISRLDICADTIGFSTLDIYKGIYGPIEFRKEDDFRKRNPKTKIPGTINYGDKTDTWFCRIYNKLKEVKKKGKERFYADYFKYPMVTRTELEIHSEKCLELKITLDKCLDMNFLFSVYSAVLYQKKYTKFKIVNFIKKELKKIGVNKLSLVRRVHEPFPLEQADYVKDVISRFNNCCKRYNYKPKKLLSILRNATNINPNRNKLEPK